jgi:uncharacterized protein YegP (UPF0339 family)
MMSAGPTDGPWSHGPFRRPPALSRENGAGARRAPAAAATGGSMPPAYKLHKAVNGQYYFLLEADSGEMILESERYFKKESALAAIETVRMNSALRERILRKTTNSGKPYFEVTAADGEPIATSETYASQDAMEKGIQAVLKSGPDAAVVDRT